MFRSTPQGRYILVNPAMARMYGYSSPQEMMDQVTDISTQIHSSPESRKNFTEALHETDSVQKFEARNLRKDGSIIWTSTNARAIRDANGGVLYYEGFITDITARKAGEEIIQLSEARYHMLVEQASDGIFISDSAGKLMEVNQRACSMLGYTRAELLLFSLELLISREELALRPLKL